LLRANLAGEITVGTYTVHEDGTCAYIVLDFDDENEPSIEDMNKRVERALRRSEEVWRRVERALLSIGVSPRAFILEFSGLKGWHAWIFFEVHIEQAEAYQFAQSLRHLTGSREAFPKAPGAKIRSA